MAKALPYTSLLFILLATPPLKGQKFNGKVESFAFDVKATPAGGAISLKPPKADIQDSDSKVDYAKTDSMLLVPPITNQVMAMVESLHSKLDVKGQYAKWNPKIRTKKIIVHHLLSPKLLPLRHKGHQSLIHYPKLKAMRRNMPLGLSRKFFRSFNRKSFFQERKGGNLIPSRTYAFKRQKNADMKRSFYQGDLKAGVGAPERGATTAKRHFESQLSSSQRRVVKREVSVQNDLSKSIETLIAASLKKRQKNRNETNDSRNERKQLQPRKYAKMSSRRKLVNEKIKELGNPEVKKYMNSITSRVSHVVSEAKNVLQNTGRIVHGIKKVITGAKLLTEFTKNAVKFAKYFAMEPSNATVDFFEEKAVMAVLEAQRAAVEAKIAAVEAKNAAKKIKDLMHKMEKKANSKSSKKMNRLVKYAESESHRAEKLAHMTANREMNARQKAVIVDKALRKMIHLANEEAKNKEVRNEEEKNEEVKNEEVNNEEVKNEEVKNEEVKNEEVKSEGVKDGEKNKQDNGENEEGNEGKNVKPGIKEGLENEKTKSSKGAQEVKDKEDMVTEKEHGSVEERQNGRQGAGGKYPGEKNLTNINKDEEEGSGTDAIRHNKATENGGSSKSLEISKSSSSNNNNSTYSNSSINEGLEASELPDIFHGGGDGNEVVANDFEKEGFSIPEAGSNNNEAEKEITSVLDKLADSRITQIEKLQQLLKSNNETNQNMKSSVIEQDLNDSTLQGSEQSNERSRNTNKIVEEANATQHHDEGDAAGSEEEEEEHEYSSHTTPTMVKKKLHSPTTTGNVLKHSKTKQSPLKTTQSSVIERRIEKINKGPLNVVVTVTRRKVNGRNKTSGVAVKEDKLTGNEGKRLSTDDETFYDPFNFQGLEAKEQKSVKEKYIVDKEDEGRAGLTTSYATAKSKTTPSSAAKTSKLKKEVSVTYDYKPSEIFTQI